MIYRDNIIDIELKSGTVDRSRLLRIVGEGDEEANRYGARVFKNGEAVDLSGYTAVGYFVRQDGNTVVIEGAVSGNEAYVDLPEACYAVEGSFTLAVKIVGGGGTATLRIIDGTVADTATGGIIDPGSIVPDLEDLMTVIERAEDAAEAIAGFSVSTDLIEDDDYTLVVVSPEDEEE